MNIREFAKLCDVSPSTVSRALGRPWEKSELSRALYDLIRGKAAEVGFRPNFHAKAMLGRQSGCIGFIAGYKMSFAVGTLLEGISSVLTPLGKNLSIYPCRNQRDLEAEAFDTQLYCGVDAIIYLPCLQPFNRYDADHIRGQLDRHSQLPPVITLYSGSEIAAFHQLRFRDYEIGSRAALRQLAEGSSRFGIIDTIITTLGNRETARGYRETLLLHGVPAEEVCEVLLYTPGHEKNLAPLAGADGLLCSYLITLPGCLPALSKLCKAEAINVDALCSTETQSLFQWLLPAATGENGSRQPFRTLQLHIRDLFDIGVRSAEFARKLIDNPGSAPYTEYLDVVSDSYENAIDADIFR